MIYIGINIVRVLFHAMNGRLNVMNAPGFSAKHNSPFQTAA